MAHRILQALLFPLAVAALVSGQPDPDSNADSLEFTINRTSCDMLAGVRVSKRGPGRGSLNRRTVKGRTVWMGDWTDADGRRHRRDLGSTKIEAEQLLAKIIRDRDLELSGMGLERGLAMTWEDMAAQYVAALKSLLRCTIFAGIAQMRPLLAALIDECRWRKSPSKRFHP